MGAGVLATRGEIERLKQFLDVRLTEILKEAGRDGGPPELTVAVHLVHAARRAEQEAATSARRRGATLQQLADAAGLPTRQAARSKFHATGRESLPGRSASDAARMLGISSQTVVRSYARYGAELRVYPSTPRPLRRYFLPGDAGHSTTGQQSA